MNLLSQSRSVLERQSISDWAVVFAPSEGVKRPVVVMHPEMYLDFDSPEAITVTIAPGDTLNDVADAITHRAAA